jgi:hypothetical protein
MFHEGTRLIDRRERNVEKVDGGGNANSSEDEVMFVGKEEDTTAAAPTNVAIPVAADAAPNAASALVQTPAPPTVPGPTDPRIVAANADDPLT